jgi:ABC-2 type transport system ATP-binding protein
MVHKYQIAYKEPPERALFDGLDILHYEQEGRVVRLVVRGEAEEVTARLKESEPVLLDVLPVSFEELFLYELESRGYGNE